MSSLIDVVREHLMKVSSGVRESMPGCFDFRTVWDNCEVVVRVRVSDEYRAVCVTVSSGIMVPMEYISDAYEFACRANYELPLGAFWVDSDSRRVSFSVTAALVDMDPSEGFIVAMVMTGINTYDKYYRALCSVIYAGYPVDMAIETAEEPSESEVTEAVAKLVNGETVGNPEPTPEAEPETPQPVRRKRGRPRKVRPATDLECDASVEDAGKTPALPTADWRIGHAVRNITAKVSPKEYNGALRRLQRELSAPDESEKSDTGGTGEAEAA